MVGGFLLPDNILTINGLDEETLRALSFKTGLGKSLKNSFHHFEKAELLSDVISMSEWYDMCGDISRLPLDYRVKSPDSIVNKYERYESANRPVNKVFNDILGFRVLCDDYEELFKIESTTLKVVDMSKGKSIDDGYRGVHIYYQLDNFHYPIEIQFNTFLDRQLNNWLHDFLYKKDYPAKIGFTVRLYYEDGKIKNLTDFKEVLEYVLSGC